jgi:hypothetical protein
MNLGEKDISEKILEDYNDVFADIVNVLLFDGKRIVKENQLENSPPVSAYRADDGKLHEMERDCSKFWKKKQIRFALFGLENQTKVIKRMPLRNFGYEGASYRSQLEREEIYPVVTLVLYFGTQDRWTAPRTLKGLINVPDYLDKYVNDIKINVYEIAWLDDETINKFTSDFRLVAKFFSDKRKDADEAMKDTSRIKHVDAVLKLLSAMTGDNEYENIILTRERKVTNMCEIAQRLINQGREEGRILGLKDGRSTGLIEGTVIAFAGLVRDGRLTIAEAAQRAGMSEDTFKENMKKFNA